MLASIERTLARRDHDDQDSGLLKARAELVEALLKETFAEHQGASDELCLIALGGLGRGELAPASDLDLLIFHASPREVAERLGGPYFRALWDAGFVEIHHSLRDREQLHEALESDLAGATSLLEGRFLAGDPRLWRSFVDQIHDGFLTSGRDRYLEAKLDELEERHAPSRAQLCLNEPDLKNGQGGLRDQQLLLLLAALEQSPSERRGSTVLPGLDGEGMARLRPLIEERIDPARVTEARRLLGAARAAAHRHAQGEVLVKPSQGAVAVELGFEATSSLSPVEAMMLALFETRRWLLRSLRRMVSRTRARLDELPGVNAQRNHLDQGLVARGDLLEASAIMDEGDADEVMRIFTLAQRSKRRVSLSLCDRIRRRWLPRLGPDTFRQASVYRQFLPLLKRQTAVSATIRGLHEAGALGLLLPEFAALEGIPQLDPVHSYTVAEHSLKTLEAIEGQGPDHARREADFRRELFYNTKKRGLLRLAALLHDIGKAGGSAGHVRRGLALVPALSSRLDLTPSDQSHLSFLLDRHLTLSRLSQTRRLNEPSTVDALLEAVSQQPLRLEHLYLLTCADMAAVSARSFTGWQDTLVTSLFELAWSRIDPSSARPDHGSRAEMFLANCPEARRHALASHLSLSSDRYLAHSDPAQVLAELDLIDAAAEQPFALQLSEDQQVLRLTIAARAWPKHLEQITGALSSLALSILNLTSWTRSDGVIVARVTVSDLHERSAKHLGPQIEARVERCRERKAQLKQLVEDASSAFPRRPGTEQPATGRVRALDGLAFGQTVIEVTARDRLGLLFNLLRVFSREGVEVHFAKIATQGSRAVDTFYVSRGGDRLGDPRARDALCLRIKEAIG